MRDNPERDRVECNIGEIRDCNIIINLHEISFGTRIAFFAIFMPNILKINVDRTLLKCHT